MDKTLFKPYLFCFLLSILLTLAAYFSSSLLQGLPLDLTIGLFALLQAFLQLLLFFNLTKESSNLVIFLFMLLVVVILVAGSIWIMNNLNYNLMVP